jgi:methyltransferase
MRDADVFALALAALAFVPMIAEALLSAANERALRASGAREPERDVYKIMQLAYPACFAAMTLEAWTRGHTFASAGWMGAAVFTGAKALKYWAIATLGGRWTFRVLVPPASQRILRGPYRILRHPNYVGVAGELAGFAALAGAPVTGVIAFLVFGVLLMARIRVEERALGLRSR